MITRAIRSAVITGPTGAIGTALCAELLANGVTVYAAVNPTSRRIANLPKHGDLHVIPCDIAQIGSLPAHIPQCDAFFHLAWTNTTGAGRNNMPAQADNLRFALDAVNAAAAMRAGVFVGAGSQAEYGRVEGILTPQTPCFPENGYGMAKLCAGQMTRVMCAAKGIAHVWLRVLSVYGPHDGDSSMIPTVIRTLLRGERPKLTPGTQKWDYLYSKDAARGFYLAARHGRDGAVYPLGSGAARPLREYVETLRDCIDPALPLGFGDVPFSEKQVMHLLADLSALTADTGFRPATAFAEGIAETIEAYKPSGSA